MENYEVKDGKGQHVFHGYASMELLLQDIATWFSQLKEPAAHIQLIEFEYIDTDDIQANVFWGYDKGWWK